MLTMGTGISTLSTAIRTNMATSTPSRAEGSENCPNQPTKSMTNSSPAYGA